MIPYDKSAFGLNLVFRVHGSAVYRSVVPALIAIGFFFVARSIRKHVGDDNLEQLGHPYAVGVLVASATFLIVFRANQAYARYWEACGGVHHMMSKWLDATSHMSIYHLQCDHYKHIKPPSYYDHHDLNALCLTRDREREVEPDELFIDASTSKRVSGPAALGLHNRKGGPKDDSADNRGLVPFTDPSAADLPSYFNNDTKISANDNQHHLSGHPSSRGPSGPGGNSKPNTAAHQAKKARAVIKSINYIADKSKRESAEDFSAHSRRGKPDLKDAVKESADESEHMDYPIRPAPLMGPGRLDGNWGALYNDSKATYFDPSNPDRISERGFASIQGGRTPSLFLQELAHLSSLLVAVAMSTLRNDIEGAESPLDFYNPGAPWPEVDPDKDQWLRMNGSGSVLQCIGSFLGNAHSPEERTRYNAARPLPVIGGVSDNEIRFIRMARGASAKTQLCWAWLSEFCIREHLAGSTGNVGPPIISRTIQFLGDGMIFYNHARKVMFIPFPFVHAQLSVLFVIVMIPAIPFLMDQYTDHALLGSILTFFTVLCLCGINEVARELENPFRNVPNELPLVTLMAQYNEALLTMFSGYHPDHFWDGERILQQQRTTSSSYDSSVGTTATSVTASDEPQPSIEQDEVSQLRTQLQEQAKLIAKLVSKVGLDPAKASEQLNSEMDAMV